MALYADYETGENVCPSNGTIARELGYGGKAPEQTVNKIVGRLRKAGWLTKTGKVPDGPVIYRLTLPKQGGMAEEPYNLHTFKSDGDGSSKPVGEERPPAGGQRSWLSWGAFGPLLVLRRPGDGQARGAPPEVVRRVVHSSPASRLRLRQLGQSAPRGRTRAAALLTRNDRRPQVGGLPRLLILHQADAGTTVASPAPWASSWPFARCAVRSASKSSQRLTISHSTPVSGFGFSYGFPCKEIGVIGEST